MADNVIWSTIYLGNLAEMDTDESTQAVETVSPLLTTFGEGPGKAMANNIVDVTSNAGGDTAQTTDNPYSDDDDGPNTTSDTVQYDLGSGTVTAKVDGVMAMEGTVTFYDGSTYTGTLGVFQTDNGDTFMLVMDNQPELASQGIDTITFTSLINSDYSGIEQTTKDDHDFVCFGPGTRIDTPLGPKRVDRLKVGDFVSTLDDGPQPIRWIAKRRLHFDEPDPAQPVLIAKGAFGPGLPRREILLSPNHRVLVQTTPAHALHDPLGALAPAKALTRQPGIRALRGRKAISYFSLLLPHHAVLIAEGIAVESLYAGPGSWAALTGPERSAWLRLAGEARVTGVPPARLLLTTAEARAGLDAGAMGLPATAPQARPWSARIRRGGPLPAHLAAG